MYVCKSFKCLKKILYILSIKMHIILLFILMLIFCPVISQNVKEIHSLQLSIPQKSQKILINGIVVDQQNQPLPGASVFEKGTSNGTVTDIRGEFRLQITPLDTIEISFVGYKTRKIKINKTEKLYITLEENSMILDDVIITALGLQKKEISLAYATEKVSKDELIRVKDPNMIVTLMGKIAGLDINKSSSGIGGSTRVILRGIRSVAGNNQPLYVIDGMPILNSSPEQPYTAIGGIADGGNRDGGDGISNLNPEDVTSISILKGAPAAALYGNDAANGVILISTRRGEIGKQSISFASNLLIDQAICLPKFQNSYGVSDIIDSWGEPLSQASSRNNARDFFNTGITAIHSLSISSGKEQTQTYFSYANTTAKGIVPHHRLNKHNLNLRETTTLYNGRLHLDGNINLMQQKVKNRPVPGGFYMNPLVGLYRFPRGMDITPYKENFEIKDENRQLMIQNWHSPTEDFEQNPYWVVNRIQSSDDRHRLIASLAAKVTITESLNLQARGTIDDIHDKFREKCYASTAPSLAGNNGRYIESSYHEQQIYGDLIATYKHTIGSLELNISAGISINDNTINSLRYDSKTASLKYANIFNIANINMNTSAYIDEQQNAHRQKQSVFATAQVGYREMLYLEVTARNDWSSTLAFTSHEKKGFYYPSVGGSWIVSNTLKLPSFISLGKIRAAWSKVGNDIPLYITNPVAHLMAGGGIQWADAAPFEEMKPETNTSFEMGTEWEFFNERLHFNFTFYHNHTRNQFFKLPSKNGDIYAYRYANAGNIRNSGVECTLSGEPITKGVQWKSSMNYSRNRNKVLSLHEELPVFTYGPNSFSSTYAMKLKKGGSFGDIYGKAFKRDDKGNIQYETEGNKAGLPQIIGDGNTEMVGNANPRFRMGWDNKIAWKGFLLSFLVDGRFGGKVLSQTQADMDQFGVTRTTGQARDRGYVDLEGHRMTNVREFYKSIVGGRAGVTEYYMYDATNIRLRELSLGYDFPKTWLKKSRIVSNLQISMIARNLCFIYKKAPFDPDLVLSTGNDNQAIDSYGMPTTRNIGVNLRFTF